MIQLVRAEFLKAALGGPLTVSEVSAWYQAVRMSELHFAMAHKLRARMCPEGDLNPHAR